MNSSSCELIEIPPPPPPDEDALTLTFGRKKNLLQSLHDCRGNKVQLDTLVLYQVLVKLEGFPGVKVFNTYCPWDKRDLPFYERYVTAEKIKAGLHLFFIRLCDGVHINGYIVNFVWRSFILVLYQSKYMLVYQKLYPLSS